MKNIEYKSRHMVSKLPSIQNIMTCSYRELLRTAFDKADTTTLLFS